MDEDKLTGMMTSFVERDVFFAVPSEVVPVATHPHKKQSVIMPRIHAPAVARD